ncbi:MAG: hypothetical protein B7Z15_10495 [Rhizobiales bacterium 32-66-8]|nr:MAG: hypothetical protein B7Z15_10495 [Rhizobiales bacterium 32-66-8]
MLWAWMPVAASPKVVTVPLFETVTSSPLPPSPPAPPTELVTVTDGRLCPDGVTAGSATANAFAPPPVPPPPPMLMAWIPRARVPSVVTVAALVTLTCPPFPPPPPLPPIALEAERPGPTDLAEA